MYWDRDIETMDRAGLERLQAEVHNEEDRLRNEDNGKEEPEGLTKKPEGSVQDFADPHGFHLYP